MGEDGTHQHLVIFAAALPVVVIILWQVLELILDFYVRIMAWQVAAQLTWHNFWTEQVAQARTNNPGGSLTEIYQEALKETKTYMGNDTVWNKFHAACQAESPLWLSDRCDFAR